MNRREVLRAGVGIAAVAAFPGIALGESLHLDLNRIPPEEAIYEWGGAAWGRSPYIPRKDALVRAKAIDLVQKAIDVLMDEAARLYEQDGRLSEVATQLRRDAEMFHDEVELLWNPKVQEVLYTQVPIPPFLPVRKLQQGQVFRMQLFQGGKKLRNVVVNREGRPPGMSDREFVMMGRAAGISSESPCCNKCLFFPSPSGDAVCEPDLLRDKRIKSVAEGLRTA